MVRRSPYAFLYLEDDYRFDVGALLSGELPALASTGRIVALALLTGERHRLEEAELELLRCVPADRWVTEAGHEPATLRRLLDKGLLLSDDGDEASARLRDRDEALSANHWNLYAAAYHYMTQWSAVDVRHPDDDEARLAERTREEASAFVDRHGPPPSPFPSARTATTVKLPGGRRDGSLYQALEGRRTTRAFATEQPMSLEQLDTVLHYVFGCQGQAEVVPGLTRIRRTSPSGGGLHPIEAYPVISGVEGIAAGIYHYRTRDHSLELLRELPPAQARETATEFMCGQSYFGAAHVSFVLAARFERTHWKYRRHHKAYAGVLMDAAHLSQTLYLVSAELGLGAYITIAINARDIEVELGLDGVSEGVIAVTGCGPRETRISPLEFEASPASPDGRPL